MRHHYHRWDCPCPKSYPADSPAENHFTVYMGTVDLFVPPGGHVSVL